MCACYKACYKDNHYFVYFSLPRLPSFLQKIKNDPKFNRAIHHDAASYTSSYYSDDGDANHRDKVVMHDRDFDDASYGSGDSDDNGSYNVDAKGEDSPQQNNIHDHPSISGVRFLHATHVSTSTPHYGVSRRTQQRMRKKSFKKKASVVFSNIVEHIYSSVYISGRTIRHVKENSDATKPYQFVRKPTIAPKPDFSNKTPKASMASSNGDPYVEPLPKRDSMIPVYQNFVKFKKRGSLTGVGQRDEDDCRVLVNSDETNPRSHAIKDKDGGYLVPGKVIGSGTGHDTVSDTGSYL